MYYCEEKQNAMDVGKAKPELERASSKLLGLFAGVLQEYGGIATPA